MSGSGRPRHEKSPPQWPSGFKTVRDLLSFLLGVAVIVNEVWLSPTVEWPAIAVGAALVGLPVALGLDETGNTRRDRHRDGA